MEKQTEKKWEIKFRGWPWQLAGNHFANEADNTTGTKYGWNPLKVKGAGRFGGWWAIKLGITINTSFNDFVIDLIIGSIRISKR